MSYAPMNPLRYEAAQPQPIYPPYLMSMSGSPAGQAAFPAAEAGHPTMLPGYVPSTTAQPARPASQQPAQPTAPQTAPQSMPQPVQQQPMHPTATQQPMHPTAQQQPMHPTAQQQPMQHAPSYGAPAYGPQYGQPTPGLSNLAAHQQAYAAYHQAAAAAQYAPQQAAAADDRVLRGRRPRVLGVAVASAVTAAGLTVASQLLALRDGRDALTASVVERMPVDDQLLSSLIAPLVEEAYRTVQARAMLSIGLAVLVALLALLCLRAGLVARIAAVTALAVTALLLMVSLIDVFPTSARMVGAPAMVLFPVTAALLFMPAVGRYRTSRRSRAA